MFASLLIGLREGLEAALVVGILVAYVDRIGRRDVLPRLWAGVAAAVVLSLGVGAILTWGPYGLSFQAQEILGGVFSLLAVGLVTWMIFWMAANARTMGSDLRSRLDTAIGTSGGAVVLIGFVSVGREGIETALLLWAATSSSQNAVTGSVAAVVGILLAIGIAWLINRGLVRVDLSRFFRWTGVFLIVVAAGILVYGIGDLQEAAILPGWGVAAFDVSGIIPPSSWYGTLLAGILNFTPQPTWAQLIGWIVYLLVVLTFFLVRTTRSHGRPDLGRAGPASSASIPA
ncbi:high-affinity iron transporter [Labedella gwakjiensis]|uniref:High-affinity Fe2+/Pb2+ permease n=1 Tax=Labedella gwakjiensis TaxID=390269 RepID=A0A2P8H133_9MICO|nr:iron uptake transporter permease EfeU [Labedella gwakjiensis]PSL39922.1 high-affinity iron transporter [Labedella gwakjiensis]RUQ85716.1 high-affinity Fe2+/Pb2+ permease [Labedella gwakjiensis]